MSPRPSPLGYLTEVRHLETYLGASEVDIRWLIDQVAAGEGFVQYVQSRNGKRRQITWVTDEGLRAVLGRALELLAPVAEDLPRNVHAFVRGRSIRSNAAQHIGASFTQTFDLADFFTQVTRRMVVDGLVHFGTTEDVATTLAGLTTVGGSLPMGFMTSPMLANTSLHAFDADVLALADARNLTVSRYADDIVFSGTTAFDIADEFIEVADAHALRVNPVKTRTARRGQRMLVTGLSIANGDRPRLPRAFRARIRQELYFITTHGLEGHADHLQVAQNYVGKRLGGRLAYAKSVDPDWVGSIAAQYPDAYKEVAILASPRAGAKRAASLQRLAERVRSSDPVSLPAYQSALRYKSGA